MGRPSTRQLNIRFASCVGLAVLPYSYHSDSTGSAPDPGGTFMTTVLVVDDQALIRQAVSDILSAEPYITVVGGAVNGARR